jgi:hypothetical protein
MSKPKDKSKDKPKDKQSEYTFRVGYTITTSWVANVKVIAKNEEEAIEKLEEFKTENRAGENCEDNEECDIIDYDWNDDSDVTPKPIKVTPLKST